MQRAVRASALVAVIVGAMVVVAPTASAQRVANPATFTLTVHTATLQIRDEVFDFSDARQPQCSDGKQNDEDLLGGSPQDSAVDFPADPQCSSSTDDSEVVGGFQPLTPVRIVGSIAADGAWNVATSGVQVPQAWLFARPPVIGATTITITTSATHAATGNLNPLTGAASLRLRLRIDIDGSGLGGDCHVGDSGNPIDINALSSSNSPGGVPYNADSGSLSMANHTFAVPGASGCSTFPINVNNEINDSLGLPSPSGQNHGVFTGDFPPAAKPLRAITADLTAAATVACRPVGFGATGSTSVRPITSYAFDDTNNGTFDQIGLSTTRSVTFATPGTRTARLRVTDDQGDFHERLRTYTVLTNQPPTAPSQVLPRSGSGDPVAVTLSGTDPEGGDVTFAITAPPEHGSLTGAAPNLTYTPDAGFGGADGFTYSVTDDCSNTRTGTVSLAVNHVPAALSQTVGTNQEVPVAITLGATDADGDGLTYAVTSPPANGSLTGTAPNLSYTPATGFSGTDTFEFQASDPFDTSSPGTVTVEVTPNSPPSVSNLSATTDEDTAVGVTIEASDPDGDALTYVSATPGHGTVTGTGPDLTYTPDPDFHGPDAFDVTVADGKGGTATATVSLTVDAVNDAPVAADQTVGTQEEEPVGFTVEAGDVDGEALAYSPLAAPTSGVVTGTFPDLTYTPTAGFVGTDSLTYSVTDPSGAADTATVTFVVTERNDPPVPVNQVVNLFEDTAVGIVLGGSDPEGGGVTIAVATGPAHGSLAGSSPNVTYTPAADHHGPDSFTFTVTDDAGQTATGTIQLNILAVNDAPVAGGTSATTAEDTAVSIALPASDVDHATAELVVQATSMPAHGTLRGSGANLTYTPAADFHGTDSFTYRVRDPQGATSTGTVSITVTAVNDAPTANAQSVSVLEDGSVTITLIGSDRDGDAIELAVASGPGHGTITGTGATVTYVPATDFHGFDSFTFTVSDGNGGSGTATITIAVLAVNDAPAAQAQSVATDEDTPIAITLVGADPDGDTLSYTIESGPTHGTLSGTAPALTYTPDPDYAGPDSFTFRVSDLHGATSTATVSITVDEVPLIATTLQANPAVARLQGLKWYYPVLSARLTETPSGTPLAGRLVGFFVQGRLVCNAVTAADGTATCGGSANSVLLAGSYSVRFDGDHDHSASSATGTVTT